MKNKKRLERQYLRETATPVGKLMFDTFCPKMANLVDTFVETHRAYKKACFFEFLAGLAIDPKSNKLLQEDIDKLQQELLDKENDQVISNILDAVFFSTNLTCRLILSIIARTYLEKDLLDYEDLVLVIALKDLLDVDLDIFKLFYAMKPVSSNLDNETCILDSYSMYQRIVLEKLQNLNILGKDLAGSRFGGTTLRFQKTTVSDKLMKYLNLVETILDNQHNSLT